MAREPKHRIVVTGIGWVTPLGHDIETVWKALLEGKSGIGPITNFDATTFPTHFGAQVKNYDADRYVKHADYHRKAGSNTRFALGAARQAWAMAGLDDFGGLDKDRVGMYLGSGEGSLDFENYVGTNLAA